jgi:hypothetical protein
MTVFKHGRTFRCDFWWHRHRFKGNTQQLCLEGPKDVERQIRVHLASRNGKLSVERAQFTAISGLVGSVLPARLPSNQPIGHPGANPQNRAEFWGARPIEDEPLNPNTHYYDLRF